MLPYLLPITSLMVGTALLLLGNGLLSTLIVLRGSLEGYTDQTLGMMGSAYFVGFFIGTYVVPKLIRRMGHIRASNFFCAAIAACTLAHSIILDPWVWIGLRLITGIVLVGFYTVIESWLNSQAVPEVRGRVFAFYMVVNMGSIAAAQQFLRIAPSSEFVLFSIAAVMVCLAVMPIAATRLPQPAIARVPRLTLARIWGAAPAAFIGAIASGLVMGTFWTMGPLYAARLGLDEQGVALLVSTMIIGGGLLQMPLGRLSDRYDRRYVLGYAAAGASAAALAMAVFGHFPYAVLASGFIYGGMAFAVYPIVVAHLVDHLSHEDILSGNAGVLLLYGIGAMIGPSIAGALMGWRGAATVPAFFAAVLAPLAIFVILQARRRRDEIIEAPGLFVPMVRTSETGMQVAATVNERQLMDVDHALEPGAEAAAGVATTEVLANEVASSETDPEQAANPPEPVNTAESGESGESGESTGQTEPVPERQAEPVPTESNLEQGAVAASEDASAIPADERSGRPA